MNFFFQDSNWFRHFFHNQVLYFCMSSAGKISISFIILVGFQSKRFREIFVDFSKNIFPVKTGITNLFHYICRISLFHQILNFTDHPEIR